MTPTIPFIKEKFDEYNRMMFDGKLPDIPIRLSNAKGFLGMCCFKKKRNGLMGKVVNYDFVLRINTRFDLPQEIVEDTIIHEMIHYYIASNQLKDTSAHGQLFRTMMNGINARFGRHIAISHKPTETQKQQAREGRRSWHVVAVVTFTDGRTGVKVLPRIVERITYYYNNVLSAKDVSAIQLYMSNDTFFNQFPNSSALKVSICEEEILKSHLADAERMECDGKRIIRNR